MNHKPMCQTLRPWLRSNLGKACLAGLTSQDSLALDAAAQIAALWSYSRGRELPAAFGAVVTMMQPTMQHLAFHAVAHFANWEDRADLWRLASLNLPANLSRCAFEPGGSQRSH